MRFWTDEVQILTSVWIQYTSLFVQFTIISDLFHIGLVRELDRLDNDSKETMTRKLVKNLCLITEKLTFSSDSKLQQAKGSFEYVAAKLHIF